jgi:hypothetical protein
MGLRVIVSKRLTHRIAAAVRKTWLKSKNPRARRSPGDARRSGVADLALGIMPNWKTGR